MEAKRDFNEHLRRVISRDPRYRADAYLFIMGTLVRAVEKLPKARHITGRELLESIRQNAIEQFGPMTATVFEHWGVKNSLDFGRIVFNMVEEGLLSKTETDALEDFKDALFFEKLFDSVSGYRLVS